MANPFPRPPLVWIQSRDKDGVLLDGRPTPVFLEYMSKLNDQAAAQAVSNGSAAAAAGTNGEYLNFDVARNTVALVNAVPQNLGTLALTPGDWLVAFNLVFTVPAATAINIGIASTSLVSATPQSAPTDRIAQFYYGAPPPIAGDYTISVPRAHFRVTVPTNVFCVVAANFGGGGLTVGGNGSALRFR